MKKLFVKTAALLAAAAMTFSAVSCSSGKESSKVNSNNIAGGDVPEDVSLSLEDMPYGGEYKQLTPKDSDVPIGVEFDPRFMTDDEAKKVVDYFYSLSSGETARLENAVAPELLKYRLETSNLESAQAFLDAEYELIKQYTQADFKFKFVLVDGVLKGDTGYEAYDALVKKAMPSAKVTEKKVFKVNCTYERPDDVGSVYSLALRLGDDVTVAVYTIDGEPYVIS